MQQSLIADNFWHTLSLPFEFRIYIQKRFIQRNAYFNKLIVLFKMKTVSLNALMHRGGGTFSIYGRLTVFHQTRTRKLKIAGRLIFLSHLDETQLVVLISNPHFAVYNSGTDQIRVPNLCQKSCT